MIRLAGLRPEKDVQIQFTGVRPGEKLHEELFHSQEPVLATGHHGLQLAAARTGNIEVLRKAINDLDHYARQGQVQEVVNLLRHHVPEYRAAFDVAPMGGSSNAVAR
jgi:O-antigen biosynthesis protein WbqV